MKSKVAPGDEENGLEGSTSEAGSSTMRVVYLISVVCALLGACGLQGLDIGLYYRKEPYVAWMLPIASATSGIFSAILGFVAFFRQRSKIALSVHVSVGGLLTAAAIALSAAQYFIMRFRCELPQTSFRGCSDLTGCTTAGACTASEIKDYNSGKSDTEKCYASGYGICEYYFKGDFGGIYSAVTPVVIFLTQAIPLVLSLYVLVLGPMASSSADGKPKKSSAPKKKDKESTKEERKQVAARTDTTVPSKAAMTAYDNNTPATENAYGDQQGYYDANGNWVSQDAGYDQQGYYDEAGNWIPYDQSQYQGYYDEHGNWVST